MKAMIFVGEKCLRNICGEIAVYRDVVPVQRVSDRDRDDEPGDVLFLHTPQQHLGRFGRRGNCHSRSFSKSLFECGWFAQKFYRGRGISPKPQNSPAMMPSASSVTDRRICSSGACC